MFVNLMDHSALRVSLIAGCTLFSIAIMIDCWIWTLFFHLLFYFDVVFQIYGMDAASGAAVLALDVSEGDHVLDLCAAPGNLVSFTLVIVIALSCVCCILVGEASACFCYFFCDI